MHHAHIRFADGWREPFKPKSQDARRIRGGVPGELYVMAKSRTTEVPRNNKAEAEPEVLAELRAALEAWEAKYPHRSKAGLGALGYFDGVDQVDSEDEV